MRVATYAQRTAATQASLVAIFLLVITIVQGSSALLTLVYHFNKALEPITALLWLLSYLVALGGLMLTHGLNWIFWLFRYRLLLVIVMFGVIASIGWSIDPGISTTRVMHLVGTSIIAIYLGFMVPLSTTLTVSAWVLGTILVCSVGAVFALPALGIESYEGSQVWRGILTSKNTLGFWSGIGVLLYISQWSRAQTSSGRVLCLFMALISLLCLYSSKSATSLLAMIVGGAVALYFYIAFRFKLGFVRMVVMAMLFTGLVIVAVLNINTAELVGRSGDLTGRGEVWAQTWNLIWQKPLTGYGYGSIWNPNDATIWVQQKLTDFTWVVFHAHNGFLQVASELGLPLALLALLMVVQQLIEIFYCQYQRQQLGVLFVLGFVIAYLVSNYSEARFLVNRELYWIFFLALPISMLRQVTVVMPDSNHTLDDDDPTDPDPRGYGARPAARDRNNAPVTKNAKPVRAIPGAAVSSGSSTDPSIRASGNASPANTNKLPGTAQTSSSDRNQVNKLDDILNGDADFEIGDERINEISKSPPQLDATIVGDDDKFDRFELNDDAFISKSGGSSPENDSGLDINLSALAKKRRQQ